jgi:hypothetical protein
MRPAPVALHFFDRPNSIDAATSFLCPISNLYASRFISRCKKCVVAAYLWRLPHIRREGNNTLENHSSDTTRCLNERTQS